MARTKSDKRAQAGELIRPPLLEAVRPANRFERWVPPVVVFLLAIVVYLPTLRNGLVSWDDDIYVYNNPQLTRPKGFQDIWTNYKTTRYAAEGQKDTPHQYYPLTLTLMYVQHRVFHWVNRSNPAVFDEKMEAPRFHGVSMVWHGVNGVLLILLLHRLGVKVWVAWVVAALLVVTPMNVATVAWAAEQKNIFALFFYMLALMCYLRHRRKGGWVSYAGTVVLFQGALWSKTVAVTFPIILFFTDRLLERRWDLPGMGRSLLRIAPLLVLALMASGITVHTEDRNRDVPVTDPQRPFIAAASIWFHALKLLVPIHQLPIYQHWNPDPNDYKRWQPAGHLEWWLPLTGLLLVMWALFHWRKKIPAHFFWGLGFYVVTQLPMMGLKNINFFQFAFVADHYVYHGCTGVFLMVAVALDGLRGKFSDPKAGTRLLTGMVCAALVAYGAKTFTYCPVWKSAETFWLTTLSGNKGCWAGWYNLGNLYTRESTTYRQQDNAEKAQQRTDQAIDFYKGAVEAKPNLDQAYKQLLWLLTGNNRYAEAEEYCGRVERYKPFLTHYFRGLMRAREQKWDEAWAFYEQAIHDRFSTREELTDAMERGADCLKRLERWREILQVYQQMFKLYPNGNYKIHMELGIAYFQLGELDKAEEHLEAALKFKPN
ncbi:MAG: tetratricopeptide repeat protein, partial [Planctomycetota bacterium]